MKSHPIMLMRPDSKQRKTPLELKRKLNSLSSDSLVDQRLVKIQTKPRSTSKSSDKAHSLSFSSSYLAPSHSRAASGDRRALNAKVKQSNSAHVYIPFLKVEKPSSHNTSKHSHFASADKDFRKTKSGSKSKSYLIDYLSQKHNTRKTESLGKINKSLAEKKTQKETGKQLDLKIKISHRTKQGVLISNPAKPNQDSFVVADLTPKGHLFAIADGHGAQGHFVSQLAAKRIESFFKEEGTNSKCHQKLFTQVYDSIQKQLFATKDFNAHTSGSTLITIRLQEKGLLTCANVGDSRAILARQIDKKNWEIIHLSEDHKPGIEKEKKRIIKKGGKIHCFRDQHGNQVGPQRVWLPGQNVQGLAMSRSIGDNISKPIGVTHEPQIIQLQLQERDKFILMASDGIWQFIQNYQILQLVVPYFKDGRIEECCDALLELAYQRWTVEDNTVVDDITFVLIFLNQ